MRGEHHQSFHAIYHHALPVTALPLPWMLAQAKPHLPGSVMDITFKPFNRDRAYYRHHRNRVITRKRNIMKQFHWRLPEDQMGRLAKGKIHCSCWLCSKKSHRLGFPKSEMAQIEDQNQQLEDMQEITVPRLT
ncbi:hypothetical protein [Paenibacillus mendelii]|uniref:Cryptic loci regulator 2 N-terminal domain-containing protein n=1 Tax=Paenibacillus mendelii TaxID=206163 RepID=A0ABV6J6Y0_9BACL|nr:hypothetical protein [Paenibacillus mendelii]MCQ6560984.1 hypothetical protein [Paenibacillus mendelii]